jgi:hypothetical protein
MMSWEDEFLKSQEGIGLPAPPEENKIAVVKEPKDKLDEAALSKLELADGDVLVVKIPEGWTPEKHKVLCWALDNTFAHHGFLKRGITWLVIPNIIELSVRTPTLEDLRLIRLGDSE